MKGTQVTRSLYSLQLFFCPTALLHAILSNNENIILFFFFAFEEKNLRSLNTIHILEFPTLLPPKTIILQPCKAIQC